MVFAYFRVIKEEIYNGTKRNNKEGTFVQAFDFFSLFLGGSSRKLLKTPPSRTQPAIFTCTVVKRLMLFFVVFF